MDFLGQMRVFVRVAEAGSFTAVAREMGSTQPTISRILAQLEDYLGTRLLGRSTRAVSLTEDGREFYYWAIKALEAASQAEDAVGRRWTHPAGKLRLGTPVAFGRIMITPRLPQFFDRYPDVKVELLLRDSFDDLVSEGIDLAIRVGDVADPSLVTRRIGTTRRIAVAAPSYLHKNGMPRRPRDLTQHDCILYTGSSTGKEWVFMTDGEPESITVQGRFATDNSEAVREAVLAGLGIALTPVWLFRNEIVSGAALIILDGYEPKPLPVYALYASRRLVAAKTRAMIDFLAEQFRREPLTQ